MPLQPSPRFCLALAGAFLIFTNAIPAAVLMLDFGATPVAAGQETNSPYHIASGGTFTDTIWNQVQTADTSTLLYSTGVSATGISLNLGATTSGTLDLTNQPDTSSVLGGTTNSGIYTTGAVGRDGIFEGTQFNTTTVGFQLTGLTAGTYDIYVTARNTSASPNPYTQTVYVGTSSIGNFTYGGFTNAMLSFAGDNSSSDEWQEDTNYLKFTVNVAAGQALDLAVAGAGGQIRGFLNSVQIVAIPEPAQGGMLVVALAGFLLLQRRARNAQRRG